jgi:hypothetical protein
MPAMQTHTAECSCGQLTLEAAGEPVRVSICHCLACQRRTGSAFAAQARFPAERVRVSGRHREYVRHADDGGDERRFRFCPDCGATVWYTTGDAPDTIAVPLGAFADPGFTPPTIAVYEARRHPWVGLPDSIERDDLWAQLQPLYEAGDYAEAAERGRRMVDEHPQAWQLLYNVACCASLAGREDEAFEHLRRAVGGRADLRALAAEDDDLAALRPRAGFRELVGREDVG